MTLPQRNTALARPTNFYYLMCKLDRAQYQPVFDYSLTALGYQVVDQHFEKAIEAGNDPSPQDIQQLQSAIKNHEIAFFVENSQTSDHVVNGLVKLARENNVPVLKVTETKPNNTKNYQEWMLKQYRALSRIQQGEK